MTKTTLKTGVKAGSKRKKYGIRTFLRTGICPPDKHYLEVMADKQILRMADDLGGLAALAGTQITILREIRQLLVFKFLVDERIMTEGLFKPGRDIELVAPLNAFYLACSNSITRNCIALGLKKVSVADDLESYLKRNYGKGKAKDRGATVIESAIPVTEQTAADLSPVQGQSGEVNYETET